MNYIKFLVDDIHSTTMATVSDDGLPQARVIDIMYYDEDGLYFLTAKGKKFYHQLINQKYIALCGVKNKKSVSVSGKVKSIGSEKLDIIFERNPYMKSIYPEGTRDALEVFCLYNGYGQYFDISEPSKIVRDEFLIGNVKEKSKGYYIDENCNGCGLCKTNCPQNCIDTSNTPAVIDKKHCLSCGNCEKVCPANAIKKGE